MPKEKSKSKKHKHHSKEAKVPVVCFYRVRGKPEMARLELELANGDEKILQYKVKIKQGCSVTALPSGVGTVPGGASTKVMLIWRRPSGVEDWNQVKPATLMVVGEYDAGDTSEKKRRIVQRMSGEVSPDKECDTQSPPQERFTFGSGSVAERAVGHELSPGGLITPPSAALVVPTPSPAPVAEQTQPSESASADQPDEFKVLDDKPSQPPSTPSSAPPEQRPTEQNTIVFVLMVIAVVMWALLRSTNEK